MRNSIFRLSWIVAFLLAATGSWAQTTEGNKDGSLLISLLLIIAIAVLVFLFQSSNSVLALESRKNGGKKSPRTRAISASKIPGYANSGGFKLLKKGYDILLEGEPAPGVQPAGEVRTFALQPGNFPGLSPIPKVLVEAGAEVKAGDPLFFDKARPEVQYVAPVSGEVIAVNRGPKRSIAEIVILADKEMKYRQLDAPDFEKCSREELVNFLLNNGAWPLIRQRPFQILADVKEVPVNVFISTFDSAPLAPNLNLVAEGRGTAFQTGVNVLNKLTSGKVYLGLDARGKEAPSSVFTQAANVEKYWFQGKHPVGNVGVQIHHIAPINSNEKVWTMGVQDVITLGAMFSERRFNAERVVALTGAELNKPQYVRTYMGASLSELLNGNLKHDHVRIISGDVLSGEQKAPDSYLDFYDDQVTVVKEGDYFETFGWLVPSMKRPTVSKTFSNFLSPNRRFEADTNTHGEKRAFVVTGQYEDLLPMDIYPQHLMKAILVNDFEKIEGLGIYELVEEDVALCEFACTSKQPLQKILRQGLDMVHEQG
ncbi:MAG: Na(+)-translocating NADH-quinone reductase subunit A [Saprospirales bacterium]|nr:Na(+)-translocating NADH-quinone reductase subunit A [Saprospirales bacterium]